MEGYKYTSISASCSSSQLTSTHSGQLQLTIKQMTICPHKQPYTQNVYEKQHNTRTVQTCTQRLHDIQLSSKQTAQIRLKSSSMTKTYVSPSSAMSVVYRVLEIRSVGLSEVTMETPVRYCGNMADSRNIV